MKHYYILSLLFFLIVSVVRGQEKDSSLIHVNKSYLVSYKASRSDKKDSETTDKEASEHFINFNPVMHFSRGDSCLALSQRLGDISKITVFTVYRSEDQLGGHAIWELYGESSYAKLTTDKVFHSDKTAQYTGGNTGVPLLSTYTHAYKPRNKNKPSVKQRMLVGRSTDMEISPFQGDIAEVIVYNRVLTGAEREKLESTLAIKYGITLGGGRNYISSDGETIWNTKQQEVFTHHVAGIGRDDGAELYQKQAHSTSDSGLLIIGVGEIASSNAKNTSIIDNGNFLIWGDNNGRLTIESDEQVQNRVKLLERHWLLQRTGQEAKTMPTTIRVSIDSLFKNMKDSRSCFLVIDESGTGNFLPENTRYVMGDTLDGSGKLEFKNVQWDKDGSGSDLFSFTMRSDLTVEIAKATPKSCDELYNGVFKYTVSGGMPPYTFKLTSEAARYDEEWKSTEGKYPDNKIENLAGGFYEFTVTDATGYEVTVADTLETPTPFIVDLGPDRVLTGEEPLRLNAPVSHQEGMMYHWSSDNGFISESASIYIDTPGTYRVTVTDSLGCSADDEISISNSFIRSFHLFSNPAKDGYYKLQIVLEEISDVVINIFDSSGQRLIYSTEGKDQRIYDFSGRISEKADVYIVTAEVRGETISKKLIVK